MKRLLLFFAITLSTVLAKGQVEILDTVAANNIQPNLNINSSANRFYKYSIGLSAFTMQQFPKMLNQEDHTDFENLNFNSVFLKFNDNQINYRFIASYYNNNIDFANECIDCEIVTGKLTDISIKTGFEKVLSYATIQPYFGFDIGFRKNRFKGSSENAGTIPFSTPYDIIAEKNGGLLSPLLGVNFNVINHLTIGVETSLEILFNYERQEKTTRGDTRNQSFRNDRNWEYLLRPAAVSVQYNFGNSD